MKTFSNISLPSYGDMSTVGTPLRANIYDFLARTYAPDEARFWQPDPNAGNYPGISAYTVCAADPVNFVDPDGCDFWHTNDVTEITRFYNAILDGQTEFDFDNWNHFEDIEFLRNLVYDDRGHKLYATTTAVEDGGFTVTCTIYNLQIRRTPSVYSLVSIQVYEPVNGILDEISYFLNPWIYNDGLATWTVGRDGRVKGIVNQKIGFPPLFGKTKIKGFKIKDVGNLSRKEKMGKPKRNMSGNHEVQNKQVDQLAKKYGLNYNQRQEIHRLVGGQGYGYHEIEELILDYYFR